MSGEHKVLTVLSCDIVGSTALGERLGSDVMHQAIDRFFKVALEAVARYGGAVNQFLGDGFMALFDSPEGQEAHALRAVLCALELNRELAERGSVVFGCDGVRVRMGLHTGPVVVGSIGEGLRDDYAASSDTTHVASRLQGVAEPGTILLSESTFVAVHTGVQCRAHGRRALKGRADPIVLHQALHAMPGVDERVCEAVRLHAADETTDTRSPYTPTHLTRTVLTSQSAREGERKLVTVLFCDLAGSTALAARLGPDVMHRVVEQFFKLSLEIAARHGGTVNQFLGDGFMALFGAPIAHEDHARRAVFCALELNREFDEQSADIFGEIGVRLRLGLNTGTVVAGRLGDNLRMDYTAIGDTTNTAARLQGACEPGTILIGESTFLAAGAHVECRSLGMRQFKGKSEAIPVHQVLRARAGGRPLEAAAGRLPLVGRASELKALRYRIDALQAGVGGVVLVVGEAGLGKSRLLAEARKVALERSHLWLMGNAVSFGQTLTYWPFLLLLRGYFGIKEQDAERDAIGKVEARLRELFGDDARDFVPYVVTMLALPLEGAMAERVKNLDGLAMGHQVFRAVRLLFERLAQLSPSIIVLDDWHWADRSSGDLLEHVLSLAGTAPLLFIIAARPDAGTPAAGLPAAVRERGMESHYAELRLAALSHDEADSLSRQLLGNFPLPLEIKETLIAKVSGNPFYLEEVIRTLIALKVLSWDERAQAWQASGLDELHLPDNVQGVISARIDRLDESLKQLLKTASVIGESFFYRVLREVARAGTEIDENLANLQAFELILERARLPELDYIFKHPLVKEAAYESILTERRRSLHRRVGECIESLFAGRLEKFYAVLAFHYARAEVWDKAQDYLFKAGDQAGEIAGNAEAVEHYRQAIAASVKTTGSRWTTMQRAILHRKMGEALFRLGDFQAALVELKEALHLLGAPYPRSNAAVRLEIGKEIFLRIVGGLARRLGRKPRVANASEMEVAAEKFPSYLSIGHVHFTFDHERTLLDALSFTRSSEELGQPTQMAIGLGCLGTIVAMVGLHGLSASYGRRAIAIAEESGHPMALGFAYHTRGVAEDCSGEFVAALAHLERSSDFYRGIGHLHFWAGSRCFLIMAQLSLGDRRSDTISRDLIASGIETGDRAARGWGHMFLGICRRQAGDYDTAISALETSIPILESVPERNCMAWADAELAVSHARLGRFARALELAERAREGVRRNRAAGYFALNPLAAVAETWVIAAEHFVEFPGGRASCLRTAGQRCRTAARWARTIKSEWAPETPRLLGTWHWLAGHRGRAEREWQRGLTLAERLGARHALAQTRLEIGRRLGRPEDIARATALFAEMGASQHVSRSQDSISPQPSSV
jgi:class 3 adenylate cyclase/tetratricopeptide (TPR) repeat protein